MSFDTIKNYVRDRLEGLTYVESRVPFDFESAPATEYDKHFILTPIEGISAEENDTINDRLYDNQTWQISIAFSKSEHNDIIKRDDMFRGLESIIKDLDNPTNYTGTLPRYMRYSSWEVEEMQDYFLLKINFNVQDKYAY